MGKKTVTSEGILTFISNGQPAEEFEGEVLSKEELFDFLQRLYAPPKRGKVMLFHANNQDWKYKVGFRGSLRVWDDLKEKWRKPTLDEGMNVMKMFDSRLPNQLHANGNQ